MTTPRLNSLPRHLYSVAATVLLWVAFAHPLFAQPVEVQQIFELQPGWNSIFLEVTPSDADIESVFAGLPILSVWHWNQAESSAEFIEDPADGLIPSAEWQGYFPRPRPEAFLTNLFGVMVNEAYLVEVGGTEPVTLRVSGRPSLLPPQMWKVDGFTLTGLWVDPAAPPSFGLYMSPSAAHAGQPIYQLSTTGHWELVVSPETTPAQSGRAYWIYSDGGSRYQGPVEIGFEGRGDSDYGAGLTTQPWTFENLHDFDVDIELDFRGDPFPVPLAYEEFDEETGGFSFEPVGDPFVVETSSRESRSVDVAVRRADFSVNRVEQVVEVTNGAGYRRFFIVGANSVQPAVAPGAGRTDPPVTRAGQLTAARTAATVGTFPYAGLWVASVSVSAVSESQLAGTTPTPTDKTFPLRLIIHVDATGKARLLREVIQLYEPGTEEPDPNNPGFVRQATLGRYVLVTSDELIPNFQGVAMRDGTLVGLRLSTTSYDLAAPTLDMDGNVGLAGILSADMVLPFDAPTNPFRHQFHPDHDNLDAQFVNPRAEAFTVTREMELEFTSSAPATEFGDELANPPDWGDSLLGGYFREELTGLHRNRIFVEGTFLMRRIAATAVLDQ